MTYFAQQLVKAVQTSPNAGTLERKLRTAKLQLQIDRIVATAKRGNQ
jgi:hypothetical protein